MDSQRSTYAIIALVMTGSIRFAVFTGRIRYQGWRVIDRAFDRSTFWTHIGAWAVVTIGLVLSAIF